MVWFARYEIEPTLTRNQLVTDGVFAIEGAALPIFTDPATGLPIQSTADLATLSNEVFIRDLFTGGGRFEGKRTTIEIRGVLDSRDFSETGRQEDVYAVFVTVSRRLSRRTTPNGVLEYSSGEANSESYDEVLFSASLNRQLSRSLRVSVGYDFRDRSSDGATFREFTENRINAGLIYTF
jgi:uncharacterized protein (PEP-CTERM system associated)